MTATTERMSTTGMQPPAVQFDNRFFQTGTKFIASSGVVPSDVADRRVRLATSPRCAAPRGTSKGMASSGPPAASTASRQIAAVGGAARAPHLRRAQDDDDYY